MLQDTIEVFLVLLHWIYIKILEYIFYFLPICCLLIPKFCFKGFHLLSIMLQSLLNCSRLICPWINNHIPCFIISIIFIFLQCSHLSRYIFNHGINVLLKSIQITLASHMEKFNLDSLIALTATDELYLQDMGEKRVALFALIPDSDTSFNFLVSILYQQLFQQLFDSADHKHGGSLPVPVHFLMDEFANISLPNDFEIKLSTMRSRNVFVSIILQNIAQLKALFEKQWESVLGNCDELLYLGGNEQGSHKYISELLGKATIDTNTYGKSSGRNGNYSTNYQITGRELMTPDEVRMLDNRKALLFIRGELPVCDDKFDILTHPLVSRTPDGGGLPYVHGGTEQAVASIRVDDWQWGPDEEIPAADLSEQKFELLSSEELEAIIMEGNYDEAS